MKLKSFKIETDKSPESKDCVKEVQAAITQAIQASRSQKELAIREWITANMDVISDRTGVYSIDGIIEQIDRSQKLERALNRACEELESLDYRLKMRENPFAYDCDYTHEDEWKERFMEE